MNWDQIERKWGEMTRRVQPTASLPSAIRIMSPQQEPDDLLPVDPTISRGLAESLSAGKPYE